MSNLALYANAYVEVVGVGLLTQENSVSIEKKSGLIPVFTSVWGLGGMTQGASTLEITIENAIPSADFEFNPDPYMRTGAVIEMKIFVAGRVTVVQGFITDSTFSHSINDSSKLSIKFLGRFADFE